MDEFVDAIIVTGRAQSFLQKVCQIGFTQVACHSRQSVKPQFVLR
jgi:hypothetical protein